MSGASAAAAVPLLDLAGRGQCDGAARSDPPVLNVAVNAGAGAAAIVSGAHVPVVLASRVERVPACPVVVIVAVHADDARHQTLM